MDSNQTDKRDSRGTSGDPVFPRIVVAVDNESGQVDRGKGKWTVRERITDTITAVIIVAIIWLGWNAWDVGGRIDTLTTNLAVLTEKYIK